MERVQAVQLLLGDVIYAPRTRHQTLRHVTEPQIRVVLKRSHLHLLNMLQCLRDNYIGNLTQEYRCYQSFHHGEISQDVEFLFEVNNSPGSLPVQFQSGAHVDLLLPLIEESLVIQHHSQLRQELLLIMEILALVPHHLTDSDSS